MTKKKINILILPKWYPRDDRPVSGIFVREFALAISKYCNVAVLFGHEDPSIKGFYRIKYKKDQNIKTFYVLYKKLGFSYLSYSIAMFLAFLKIRKNFYPDIIHVHVYSAGILALILKYLYNIPYVVTEHFKIIKDDRLFEKIKILLGKIIFEKADLLIHVSEFMVRDIEKYGIRNKYVIIPNVVNTSIFYYSENFKNKNSEKKHILFVGNPTSRKGVDYLLKAIHVLKKKRTDFILNIVGDGEECQKYKNMCKNLDINDITIFHGIKSKQEIAKMMQKCQFLVLPSLWENLPCVLIESISAGLPVIATDVGGIREIVNKNTGIIVPPGDADKLSSAIDFMLDNYSKYNRNKISEYGRKRFDYNIIGKKLYNIYKNILNRKCSHISGGNSTTTIETFKYENIINNSKNKEKQRDGGTLK